MRIETERLIIRNYEDKDLKDLCQFLLDKEQMYYIPEHFEDEEAVVAFMKTNISKFYVVEVKAQQRVVGHLSFEAFFEDHSYEIGWVFNKEDTGLGYAYEAAYALMDYGFKELKIHRIIATAQPENTASWKLMENLQCVVKLTLNNASHFKKHGGMNITMQY